jgi:hypothetical protein
MNLTIESTLLYYTSPSVDDEWISTKWNETSFNSWFIWTLLLSIIVFTLVCEWNPRAMSNWNGLAWTSTTRWNFGKESFRDQSILYQVFHTSFFCRLCHGTLFTDAIGWSCILWNYTHPLIMMVWLIGLVLQCFTFGQDSTSCQQMLAIYSLLHIVGTWIPIEQAIFLLIFGPVIRVLGHALGEKAPPRIFDHEHEPPKAQGNSLSVCCWYARTAPYGCWIVLWGPFIGFISELQAGLPCRLLPIACSIVFDPRSAVHQNESRILIQTILQEGGWEAWSVTKNLFGVATKASQ